jgi:acyl-homoserine-lactone acylase
MRFLNMLAELGKAQSVPEFTAAMRKTQGDPIFNLLATDAAGRTVYSGQTITPNVPDALAERCNTDIGRKTFTNGLAVLDGARSDCRWGNDRDALQPGVFGPGNLPLQERSDYVANSNQSYWLTNAKQPMRKLPRIVGDFETERNMRTRDTITEITGQLGRFDLKSTQDLVFSNRMYAVDDTVALCRQMTLGKPCDVLAQWDRRGNVDSRGTLLFSRFWTRIGRGTELWKVPFNVKDPVGTPNTLNTANPAVAKALPDAIGQERMRTNSSGYVRVVAFNGGKCPDARSVLAYQQPELFG